MSQMMIFVSHAHEDDVFCRTVVEGLRRAGADVWYDEHNLGSGRLMEVIQCELGRRPIVLVILSKAAFVSSWVRREVMWAYELMDRDPSRLLLPVTAAQIERSDFDPMHGWLFLHDFKRIEAPGFQPYPVQDTIRHLLYALALTHSGEVPGPTVLQPEERVDDLLARGKAMQAQGKHFEALPLFERVTQLAPHSFSGWINLGYTLERLRHYDEAIAACDQALVLAPNSAAAWNGKGAALHDLHRYGEALAAYDSATILDPNFTVAWRNKAIALRRLGRIAEAETAERRAKELGELFD